MWFGSDGDVSGDGGVTVVWWCDRGVVVVWL